MNMSVLYNGFNISVENEHGHYKLSYEKKEQRCDIGELNEAIPDFANILEKMEKRRQVLA